MYILLSLAGERDAHEIVRTLTLECERERIRLVEAAKRRPEIWSMIRASLERVGLGDAEVFFSDPYPLPRNRRQESARAGGLVPRENGKAWKGASP